jgi:hypothetical protein
VTTVMAYESKIFSIDPDIEKRIHPDALRVLMNWEKLELSTLQAEVAADDIDEHLKDDEKAEFKRCVGRIGEILKTCMDVGNKVPLYDVYIGDIFLKNGIISDFQRISLLPLFFLKLLLEKVCSRKLEKERREAEEAREKKRREEEQERERIAKAEEERKEKERQEEAERERAEHDAKWHEGFKALGEGLWDAAERYLGENECHKFHNAVIEAIELHIKTGGKCEKWELPFDYRWYRDEIKVKKAKEKAKGDAENQAASFNQGLNHFTEKLKGSLSSKQNTARYFNKSYRLATDNLYECLSPEQKDKLMDIVHKIAEPRLQQLVPEAYRNFVSWENFHYYRFHPIADYIFEGVPCLSFSFEVEAVAESEIQLIPSQRVFGDCSFNLPVINNEGYSGVLQKPKFLGYFYQHFGSKFLPAIRWQIIPLTIVTAIIQRKMVVKDAQIVEMLDAETTFELEKFEDIITIPAVFRDWLRKIGGLEGMAEDGVISNQVLQLISEATPQLAPAPMEQTTTSEQPPDFTKEQFIKKLTGLGYPEAHAEILSEKIPKGLGLDGAVRWALREYQRIIAENPTFRSYHD